MESRDWYDISYLLSLLLSSGLAFIIIAISYSRIYYSLGKETRQAEMTVAKKMILLVSTNFACWLPIAFFSFTAMVILHSPYSLLFVIHFLIPGWIPIDRRGQVENPVSLLLSAELVRQSLFVRHHHHAVPQGFVLASCQVNNGMPVKSVLDWTMWDIFYLSFTFRCGLCVKRAQNYKISYSIPTVNNTMPLMSTTSSSWNSWRKKDQGGGGHFGEATIVTQETGEVRNNIGDLTRMETQESEI